MRDLNIRRSRVAEADILLDASAARLLGAPRAGSGDILLLRKVKSIALIMQNTMECRMKSVALTWGFCALAAPALAATLAARIGH
jgi:hypothetical protein